MSCEKRESLEGGNGAKRNYAFDAVETKLSCELRVASCEIKEARSEKREARPSPFSIFHFPLSILLLFLFPFALFAQEGKFNGKDVAYWSGRLTSTDASVNVQNRTRWYAGYALGEIGPQSASAVGVLSERLLDVEEYEYTRAVCAWALGRIQDKKAIPVLTDALKSKMDAVLISTAQALGTFGTNANSSAEALSTVLAGKSLDDSESADVKELTPPVKAALASALWRVSQVDSENAKLGADALLDMLKKNSTLNRIAALSELLTLTQDDNKDLTPFYGILTTLLEKTSIDDIARDSGIILMNKNQTASVEALLKSDDTIVRRRALRAICQYKEAHLKDNSYSIPVETILPLAQDENPLTRVWAIRTLGLAMDNKEAENAVVKAVEDDNVYVKKTARKALKN